MNDGSVAGGAKIEGGIDALVLGASVEGLTASALLAKAGLHTVLLDIACDDRAPTERREISAGYFHDEGDPLSVNIDPDVIGALDLYRHGLSFAARRMATLYRFADGSHFEMPADVANITEIAADIVGDSGESFAALIEATMSSALRFKTVATAASDGNEVEPALLDAVDDVLKERHLNSFVEDLLRTEAGLAFNARPSEGYSWGALVQRLSGETAGLQGATGFIEGGAPGLTHSLRRAAQANGVEIRRAGKIKRALVEWDRIAGVSMESGDQLRAPIVISAMSAATSFLELIGRGRLDVEFARLAEPRPPLIASARVAAALSGEPPDQAIVRNLQRRFVVTLSERDLHAAWRLAAAGSGGGEVMMELTFPSAFDASLAPPGCLTVNALVHPVPFIGDVEEWETLVRAATSDALKKSGISVPEKIVAVDVGAPELAHPPVISAMETAHLLTNACGVEGYFFCGREACVGRYASGSAGRKAALAGVDHFKRERAG